MIDLLSTAGAAAVVFAATDIDDIVILTLFFVAARTTGQPRTWEIVAGQYLGIGALALASAVIAGGLLVVPDPWTGCSVCCRSRSAYARCEVRATTRHPRSSPERSAWPG